MRPLMPPPQRDLLSAQPLMEPSEEMIEPLAQPRFFCATMPARPVRRARMATIDRMSNDLSNDEIEVNSDSEESLVDDNGDVTDQGDGVPF